MPAPPTRSSKLALYKSCKCNNNNNNNSAILHEQNWPSCAELTNWHRNCQILQILFNSIALSSALTAATASTKHFSIKVIKYLAVLCINAAVTGSPFQNVTNFEVICICGHLAKGCYNNGTCKIY